MVTEVGRAKRTGWVVHKFEDITREDTAHKLAEAWLQVNAGNFKFKSMVVEGGIVYIAGVLF